jgi:adenosylcobinamide-GDP ribazoletransferase
MPPRTYVTGLARAVRLAFAFLTVLPLRSWDGAITDADLAASRFAYPLVGGAIGLALALLSEAMTRLGTPGSLAAFLLLAAWVAVSGGLHLDGLADTGDGLFLGGGADRRLAAMRDPHVGSFGASALVLVLLGKLTALEVLAGGDRATAVFAAAAVSRTILLVSAGLAPYARPEGTGRVLVEATTPRDASWAAVGGVALGGIAAGWPGLLAGLAALGIACALTRLAIGRLGGITGDILGAVVELGELAVLIGLGLARS